MKKGNYDIFVGRNGNICTIFLPRRKSSSSSPEEGVTRFGGPPKSSSISYIEPCL